MGRILVVENEADIREILVAFLNESGYKAHVVENGRDALKYIKKFRDIDLIISDIRMPVMGGNDLARNIRSLNSRLAIIGITGSHWECEPDLFDTILDKPFHLIELAEAVARVLG